MNWNEALPLTLPFPVCLSNAAHEGLLPSSWWLAPPRIFEGWNRKKQLKIASRQGTPAGAIVLTRGGLLLLGGEDAIVGPTSGDQT